MVATSFCKLSKTLPLQLEDKSLCFERVVPHPVILKAPQVILLVTISLPHYFMLVRKLNSSRELCTASSLLNCRSRSTLYRKNSRQHRPPSLSLTLIRIPVSKFRGVVEPRKIFRFASHAAVKRTTTNTSRAAGETQRTNTRGGTLQHINRLYNQTW